MATEIYSEAFQEAYAEILIECWSDDEFRHRFISDPIAILKEWDIDIAEGGVVKVLEVTEDGAVAISLPPKPEGFDQLSDEDLESVAGGFITGLGIEALSGMQMVNVRVPPSMPCK